MRDSARNDDADAQRIAVEAALTPELRAALDELCDLLGVRRDRWQNVKSLAVTFESAAVERLALRHRARGVPFWSSYRAAAQELGLVPSTVNSRVIRPREQSRGKRPT